MALVSREFNDFMVRKVMSSRRFEKEIKGKEEKRDNIQCVECKKHGYMKHECPKKEKNKKKKDVKGKKVLNVSIECDDEENEIEEALGEFSRMAIEEIEGNGTDELQQSFKDLYVQRLNHVGQGKKGVKEHDGNNDQGKQRVKIQGS